MQPLSSSLSLASKCFRISYAPWKHFGAYKYQTVLSHSPGGPYFSVFIGSYWEWNNVQPLSSPLSLTSKCFKNSYAPLKHFSAFKY